MKRHFRAVVFFLGFVFFCQALVLEVYASESRKITYSKVSLFDAVHAGKYDDVLKVARAAKRNSTPIEYQNFLNLQDRGGFTALMAAASAGHRNIVEFLLKQGADPSILSPRYGYGALHYAAQYGHNQVVQLLLDHKDPELNVDQLTSEAYKKTPFLLAAQGGLFRSL